MIDDLVSTSPWTPRGIAILGSAQPQDASGTEKFGPGWDAVWIRILPSREISWRIEAPPFSEGSFKARTIAQA